MSIIPQIHSSKKNNVQILSKNINSSDFLELLSDDDLNSIIENNLPEHRKNIYTPARTLSMFLAQSLNEDRSCTKAVNDLIIQQQRQKNMRKISSNTGAYCIARKKIPLPLVSQLTTKIAGLVHEKTPKNWLWKGKRVHLIDGTTLTMPDTPENQKEFPQPGGQKEGLGFPICRVLAVSCLSSGVILNAAISPLKGKGSDEQTLLREVIDTFKQGDLVMGDAIFGTYFLLAEMIKRGVDVLFEQMGPRKKIPILVEE
ncbi:MAG: IS4 family transposase [Pseudomonadales bacterium]|nr:IS4 family transposase [Pseudomonadales bacterium]